MKKYIIVLSIFCVLNTNAQNLTELMAGFDNKFALEHTELFTKEKNNSINPSGNFIPIAPIKEDLPFPLYESIKIINVDSIWLQKITDIIKQNPKSVFPYLDTNTQNLAAYILLSHIFEIDIPKSSIDEILYLTNLKRDVFSKEQVDAFANINTIPVGMDKSVYMLNTIWKDIAPTANLRIKAVIN